MRIARGWGRGRGIAGVAFGMSRGEEVAVAAGIRFRMVVAVEIEAVVVGTYIVVALERWSLGSGV